MQRCVRERRFMQLVSLLQWCAVSSLVPLPLSRTDNLLPPSLFAATLPAGIRRRLAQGGDRFRTRDQPWRCLLREKVLSLPLSPASRPDCKGPRMQSRIYSLLATEPPSNPKRRQALKEEMWKTEASDTIVCQACYDAGTAQQQGSRKRRRMRLHPYNGQSTGER